MKGCMMPSFPPWTKWVDSSQLLLLVSLISLPSGSRLGPGRSEFCASGIVTDEVASSEDRMVSPPRMFTTGSRLEVE